MIPVWPAELPQKLKIRGYNEAFADNLLRTSMDMGPAKQRPRGTAGTIPISGRQIHTLQQLDIFKVFYRETLFGGALRFSWVHPVDQTPVEMCFTFAPSWTSVSGELFDVTLQLEILP